MGNDFVISWAIEHALRSLRFLKACEVLDPPYFDITTRCWIVLLQLRISDESAYISKTTRWSLSISETYPYGSIELYPASEGGVSATFPHQAHNSPDLDHPGRLLGKLCLDTPYGTERRLKSVREPIGDAESRLKWHIERALAWLYNAVHGQLIVQDDPFELPSQAHTALSEWRKKRIVYDESPEGFDSWHNYVGEWGKVELGELPGIENIIGVISFVDRNEISINKWTGRQLKSVYENIIGFWWLWRDPIIIHPWHSPGSWGELRQAGHEAGIEVDQVLKSIAVETRGIDERVFLLLGYPVPMKVGLAPTEVHWDGLILPRLPPESGKPPDGFRPNAIGWWQRDRKEYFYNRHSLEYIYTENWNSNRLQARGRLPQQFTNLNVALLGVGALGSCIAEQLARTGLKHIALFDPQIIESGNICRHIATLDDIGSPKVDALYRHLLKLSPFINVIKNSNGLPQNHTLMTEALESYDVVIDCTASDEAMMLLARGWWSIPRTFVSFSLGFGAKRLFSFGVTGQQFPQVIFKKEISPWLKIESQEWSASEELFEGAGCWSPLFPARYDDIVMAASVCIKELITFTTKCLNESHLRVFEKNETEEGFVGFSLGSKNSIIEAD